MSQRRELTKELVRDAVKSIGAGGAQWGYALLYSTLQLSLEAEKDVTRNMVNEMTRTGEVARVKNGVFTYNNKYRLRTGESPFRARVWRFVRKAKPGWTLKEASLMTGVSYTHVSRYCDWLELEGYISANGKNGTARTFRATDLADKCPEMPQSPTEEKNPFEKECRAAGRIANLMLYGNLYAPKTAREIADACAVLQARFASHPN